jgi:hypothetical protein
MVVLADSQEWNMLRIRYRRAEFVLRTDSLGS